MRGDARGSARTWALVWRALRNASLAATKASANKTRKELAAYASKNGLGLIEAPVMLRATDFSIGQSMPDARQVVRWAFEAKEGEVSEPFPVGDQFVVATLDKKIKKGYLDATNGGREGAESLVRNELKAGVIKKNLGANPTLEAAAAKYSLQVMQAGADSSLTMAANIINGIGEGSEDVLAEVLHELAQVGMTGEVLAEL